MPGTWFSSRDIDVMRSHVKKHAMSLALVRSEKAPKELEQAFDRLGKVCGLKLIRVLSSPNSDFGIVELASEGRLLVVLFIGGDRTELVSVSETDEVFVKDLEDSIHSSNFCSEIVRAGL